MATLAELLDKITSKEDFVKLEMLNTNPSTGSSGIISYRIYYQIGSTKSEINTETCDVFVENFNSPGKESAKWKGVAPYFVAGAVKSSFETVLESKKVAVMKANPRIKKIINQLVDTINNFAILDAYFIGDEKPPIAHKKTHIVFDEEGTLEIYEYS